VEVYESCKWVVDGVGVVCVWRGGDTKELFGQAGGTIQEAALKGLEALPIHAVAKAAF
jgi:hypothetical protein